MKLQLQRQRLFFVSASPTARPAFDSFSDSFSLFDSFPDSFNLFDSFSDSFPIGSPLLRAAVAC